MLSIKLEQSASNNSAVIEKKPAELKNKSPKYKVLLHNDPVNSMEYVTISLQEVSVVGTPGSVFGLSGEGYFRMSAYNSR